MFEVRFLGLGFVLSWKNWKRKTRKCMEFGWMLRVARLNDTSPEGLVVGVLVLQAESPHGLVQRLSQVEEAAADAMARELLLDSLQ